MKQSGRAKNFDIYKAVAIVMVVWGHVLFNAASGIATGFISFVHMPVFYLVSGFFLEGELKRKTEIELIRKKCAKLMIPYFAWSLISFLANAALIIVSDKEINMSRLAEEAVDIFIFSRSVWFLVQLFLAQALFAVIHKAVKSELLRVIVNLLVWGLLIVFCHTDVFMMWKIKWLYGFLLLGYYAGMLEADKKWDEVSMGVKSIAFIILVSVWIAVTCIKFGSYSYDLNNAFSLKYMDLDVLLSEGAILLCGLTGAAALYIASCFLAGFRTFDVLAGMGQYTLDIYLIHMMLIFLIKKAPMPQNAVFIASFLYSLIPICFGIYLLAKYVLRKIKIYRFITQTS